LHIQPIDKEQAWTLRHRVMWPEKELDFVKLDDDHQGLHYGLFVENNLVSVVSVFISGDEAQFRKFATQMEEQGKGYGSILLNRVFDYARERGVKRIWCNARANKAAFYAKFGLIPTGDSFTKEGLPYLIMELYLNTSDEDKQI
jgi:predicted GNAT family N-acyltransferase